MARLARRAFATKRAANSGESARIYQAFPLRSGSGAFFSVIPANLPVIPAKAGIQPLLVMLFDEVQSEKLDSSFRWNDEPEPGGTYGFRSREARERRAPYNALPWNSVSGRQVGSAGAT
jgi:hypothetical protein